MRRIKQYQIFIALFLLVQAIAAWGATDGALEKAKLDSVRVHFEAQNMPLREALQNLAAQTNMEIVFHDALVKDIVVNCACNNASLRDALNLLLQPALLTFDVMKEGQIVIVKRKVDLKGYVKAVGTGENLPYANIMIAGTSWGTTSNVNGYFVLVNVPAGACTLRVSYIGYESIELPIMLTTGHEMHNIAMRPRLLQSKTVSVTAENLQTLDVAEEAGQLRLAPQQVGHLPSVGETDIFRALQLMPGISGANEASSGLYVRGGTPEQNLILFDNITIYHVDHFFGFSSAFNNDAIKDVRIFKGGYPAKFGGRVSSIVELTGKTGSYNKLQAGGTINLLSGSGIVQVPIWGHGAWLLSYRRSYTDIIKSALYNDIYRFVTRPPQPNDSRVGGPLFSNAQPTSITPDFYYYDLISKLSYSISGRDVLSLSFYNSQDNLDLSQNLAGNRAGPRNEQTTASSQETTQWGNLGASGRWSRVWNDRFYTIASGAYSIYSSESRGAGVAVETNQNSNPEAFRSAEKNEVRDLSLQWENGWHVNRSHHLEFGMDFNRTNVRVGFMANDTVNILQRDDTAPQIALYAQDRWKIFTPLELTMGLRTINYQPTHTTYVEPRVLFRLALTKQLALKGAWGEYHQFVNRITNDNALNGNRDFWLLADDRLAPNFADHKILGATYENQDFLFDLEAYRKELDNVAEFAQRFRRPPGASLNELFLLGTGVAQGVEFLMQKKSGAFNGWTSYTLAKVEYHIPGLNQGKPFPADHDRRHEIKLAGNYAVGKWNLALTWIFASGIPYSAPTNAGTPGNFVFSSKNTHRLPAYHRIDISCSRQFRMANFDWEAGLSLFNLYDRRNVIRREYFLSNNALAVRDITALGFTPTVMVKMNLQ